MPTDLENAVLAGDQALATQLLAPMTEADRRAQAPAMIALLRKIKKDRRGTWGHDTYRLESTASLAVLGTATLSEIKSLSLVVPDETHQVLVDRRPTWLGDWGEWSLRDSEGYRANNTWTIIRKMVVDGIIDRPVADMYYLCMAEHAKKKSVKEFLLANPDLLEYDVWQLFRIEGNQQFSMAAIDKYSRSSWTAALVDLMNDGVLDRNRLLDSSLDALSRDFPEFRSGWFSRFHEALSPTVDERRARQRTYLDLIGSKIPPTVSFALNAIAFLDKAGAIDGAGCIDAIGPAFYAAEKKTVTHALKLLAAWVKQHPTLKSRAVDIATPALEHTARDIRDTVLAFMTANGYEAPSLLSYDGRPARPHSASATGAMPRALDGHADPSPEASNARAPLTNPVVAESSLPVPILPIDTVEALVDAFAQVIETEGPPDDLERVLDGVSRLCDQRPPDFDRLTGPLRKRARRVLLNNWPTCLQGYSVKDVFAGLAVAWLDGELPPASTRRDPRGVARFIGARVRAIAERVARREPAILLSAPTHSGGWIDPFTLVDRLRQSTPTTVTLDLIQALLRLRPEGRPEALAAAADNSGEVGDAVRHALGASNATVGPSTSLWFAASRGRNPWADDPLVAARHRPRGPGTSVVGHISFRWRHTDSIVQSKTYYHHWAEFDLDPPLTFDLSNAEGEAQIPVDCPTLLMFSTGSMEPSMMRWTSIVWPANRENWFAAGCHQLGNNLDWWGAEWGNICFLEPLLEQSTRLDGMGGVLLSLGLAAKETKEGWTAREALIAAITVGRVDANLCGKIIGRLFSWDHIKLPRVTARVLDAARESARHAETLHAGTGLALSTAPPAQSGALGTALDLYYDLSLLTNSKPTEAVLDYLRAVKGSNRAATMAKKIIAL